MSGAPAPAPKSLDAFGLNDKLSTTSKTFVVMNVYATWCKPCVKEMPELAEFARSRKEDTEVVFLSVDKQDAVPDLPAFLGGFGIDFETYHNASSYEAMVRQHYPNWQGEIPLTLVFRKGGELLEANAGPTTGKELSAIINRHSKMGSM